MAQMDDNARLQMTFEAQKKSTGAAYLLWLFLGGLGAHRFYLGQTGTAIAQMLLFLLGWIPFFVGWFALGIWLIVDAILIPSLIEQENMKLVNTLSGGGRPTDMPGRPAPAKIIE